MIILYIERKKWKDITQQKKPIVELLQGTQSTGNNFFEWPMGIGFPEAFKELFAALCVSCYY